MTRDDALTNAIKAVEEAESLLRSGHTELSYSWSVIADTWAHVARAIDPESDDLAGHVDELSQLR
jgi:hypothetical protein